MDAPPSGIEVPWQRVPVETLRAMLEEFVTRDGTDYGAVERTLDEKILAVQRQLERGDAVIRYDPESETFTIAPRDR